MAGDERLYVIATDVPHEHEEGLVRFDYYLFESKGVKVLPVFTTADEFRRYVRANLAESGASDYMNLMEGGDPGRAEALAEGRFKGLRMEVPDIAELAVNLDVDVLMRDPRPGERQEIIKVPK